VSVAAPTIDGRVAPGFEPVLDEFRRSFAERGEHGAAFAATLDGRTVVDLWGGAADAADGKAWREDTLTLVYSGTKGLVATCVLLLLERGALELEAPVARYWPELAAAGKGSLLVRHVVSHTAGLPGLRGGFSPADLLDPTHAVNELAASAPFWPPGERLAYHALTYGWLCDGLIRRVDGRSVGRLFADEIAGPLGLELWIGLPPEQEHRVSRLRPTPGYGPSTAGDVSPDLLHAVYGDLLDGSARWNDPTFHRVEIPAANAIGTARSLARLYACLACGGELDGVRLLTEEAVRTGRQELARGVCAVTHRPYAFGVGFELQTELAAFGPPAGAFGHTGSGGSSHGAWPEQRVSFSYVMNQLRRESGDDRARRLLGALYGVVSG
jgi:CubicO group peptidase (beta-lactamase class C family)